VRTRARLVALVPLRFQTPLRYWYRRATRRLEAELPVAQRLARAGSTCIDVGANTGVYAYALSRVAAKVEAFEPLPECERIIRAFASPKIDVHRTALSDAAGQATLYIPLIGGTVDEGRASFVQPNRPFRSVVVPVRTLDEFRFTNVSLIKIDVEGHELRVLRGARETLSRERPAVLVEVVQAQLSFPMTRVFDEITAQDYHGFFILGERWRSIEEFSYDTHQAPYTQFTEEDGYVYNFIFVPSDDRQSLRFFRRSSKN
jgi:FkbM family methyltransferase